MNASTKVFSVLSLSAAIGELLEKSTEDDRIKYRSRKLREAGYESVSKYPFPALSKSKIDQVAKKIDQVCKPDHDIGIVKSLSFLNHGIIDIMSHMPKERKELLESTLKRQVWVQQLFDPGFKLVDVHNEALDDYEEWVK